MFRRLAIILAVISCALAASAPAFAQAPAPVPALPDAERRVAYSPSAAVGPFAINFALYGTGTDYGAWVEVWLNGARLTPITDFTVTLTSGTMATAARPLTNAQVTLAVASTGTLQIVGAERPRRLSQFANNQPVAARDLNVAFTDLVVQNREAWDKINDVTGRTIVAPPGESMAVIAPAASRAGKFLVFDSLGNPIFTSPTPGLGNVAGPASSVVDQFATWNSIDGTLLKNFNLFGTANNWTAPQTFLPSGGLPSAFHSETTSTTGGFIAHGLALEAFSGSNAGPSTTSALPTVFISRTETVVGIPTDPSSALYVVSLGRAQNSGGSAASQTQAIVAYAEKDVNSTGDVAAVLGKAYSSSNSSLGGVFGGFFQAIGTTVHTSPIGAEINSVNGSGVAVAYNPLLPPSAASIGIDLVYTGAYAGSTNANGTVGIVLRGDGAGNAWDVGIGVLGGVGSISPNSIAKAVLQDDSSATNVLLFNSGAHTYGIRGTGATYSTAALAFPGFTVSGTGALTATTLTSASISTGQYTFNNQSNIGTGPGFSHSTGNAFLFSGGTSGFQFNNNAGTLGLMTLSNAGSLGLIKMTASGTAPGAAAIKLEAVAGTNAGTCKLIMYAGTSATAVTILDNVGAGC